MQKQIFMALAVVGAFTLAGCETVPATTTAAPATPVLSDEAKMALSWAEADVKEASKLGMEWTNAESALSAAKSAANQGDSATTIKQAKLASEYAKLGIAQKKYPHTPVQ